MNMMTTVLRLLLAVLVTEIVAGQGSVINDTTTCGANTVLDGATNQCFCVGNELPEDPSRIYIAGLMDADVFDWCPDIFEFTVEQINQGRWGLLNQQYLNYTFRNSKGDETIVVKEYWDLRKENGNKAMDGVVGERSSGASLSLARITGKHNLSSVVIDESNF
jgi:hypothetical protein